MTLHLQHYQNRTHKQKILSVLASQCNSETAPRKNFLKDFLKNFVHGEGCQIIEGAKTVFEI